MKEGSGMGIAYMLALILLFGNVFTYAQSPVLKVDLNIGSRQEEEVNEPGYIPWPIYGGPDSQIIEGVKFAFKNGNINAGWYKAGVQSPYYARLANDGIKTDNVELHITGLMTGKHTLVTFHNTFDNPETNTFSPMDVYLNDKLVYDNLELTNRATSNDSATSAFFEFDVEENDTVIIRFQSDPPDNIASAQITICGFLLNSSDPQKIAKFEYPEDKDEHVDIDNDTLVFHWDPPAGAVSYDIYMGEDKEEVLLADTSSGLFLGNISDTFFIKSGFYSMDTYYWRVDVTNSSGNIAKGNVWYFRPRHLAFPGAEGYGRFATGGRGGKVVFVTNLNDSGPGSFREAVTSGIGPRTVIFNVSGIIKLESRLVMDDYVTVAGQTAPGKGICFRAAPLGVSHEGICRFVRMRVGAGTTYDGIGMAGVDHGIIDHCSISWAIDECFSSRNAKNITLQHTLISEALSIAGHKNYPPGTDHGFSGSISGDVGSFHHNLLAHNSGRNWSLAGGLDGDGFLAGRLDIFNNVVYNWSRHACYNGAHEVNFVNNYYKRGPATDQTNATRIMLTADEPTSKTSTQRYYFAGNVMPGVFDESNQEIGRTPNFEDADRFDTMFYEQWVDHPFFPSYAAIQSAGDAYKRVLSDVGCTMPVLDNHDKRMIDETFSGTYAYVGSVSGHYGLIDDEADAGGYEDYPELTRLAGFDTDSDGLPDWWEELYGTNPNSGTDDFSDANADPDEDGYTVLEDYLYWMSVPHYYINGNESDTIDLSVFTTGYSNNPGYKTEIENSNLTVMYIGSHAIITPKAGSKGINYFDFKVTDAEGASMTRTIGICIEPTGPSSVQDVLSGSGKEQYFDIYPNLFGNRICIDAIAEKNDLIFVELLDINGRAIQSRSFYLQAGFNKLQFDCQENMLKQFYVLKISDPDTGKLLKVSKVIKR